MAFSIQFQNDDDYDGDDDDAPKYIDKCKVILLTLPQIKGLFCSIDLQIPSFHYIIMCERENPLCTHPKYTEKVYNGRHYTVCVLQKDQISMSIQCTVTF